MLYAWVRFSGVGFTTECTEHTEKLKIFSIDNTRKLISAISVFSVVNKNIQCSRIRLIFKIFSQVVMNRAGNTPRKGHNQKYKNASNGELPKIKARDFIM